MMVAHGGEHDAHTAVPTTEAAMSGMSHSGASMMDMVFFTSTSTPLYSNRWTPNSAGQYAGTCIFLIFLATALRAIFFAKYFFDAKAQVSATKRRYVVVEGAGAEKIASDANSTTGILTTNGIAENVRVVHSASTTLQPWRFSVDLPRALLMTLAVGIGYLLMLAVMTYNVGYFLSVVAGAFIGEVAFGRYTHGVMVM